MAYNSSQTVTFHSQKSLQSNDLHCFTISWKNAVESLNQKPDLPEELQADAWFVYVVETFCGKLYTGITVDVARRFQEHCEVHAGVSNKGAKFFRGHKPKRIALVESLLTRSEASKRESQIKAMSRQAKLKLVAGET